MIRKNRIILPALLLLLVLGLAATKVNVPALVKDAFVSVKTSDGNVKVIKEGTSSAIVVEINNTAIPSATATSIPKPSSTSKLQNKTSVTVNGKTIEPDANGNVNFEENTDTSNVSVKVNNSSSSETISNIETHNNVSVNVTNE